MPCSKFYLINLSFMLAVSMTLHVSLPIFQVVCTVIAAFLQYFFLVEFFLMLAMGVYYFLQITVLYYSFSTANDIKARLNMKRLLPIAWGTNTRFNLHVQPFTKLEGLKVIFSLTFHET